MTEGREGLAGLVGGEAYVGQHLLSVLAQYLVPELEDFLDLTSAHVAVRVVLLVLARVAPEETARLEIPVVVEVSRGERVNVASCIMTVRRRVLDRIVEGRVTAVDQDRQR